MTIESIYDAARARGLVHSKRGFSRAFLGRAGNYLAENGFVGCSADALLALHRRLGELGHADLQSLALDRLLAVGTRGGGAVRE